MNTLLRLVLLSALLVVGTTIVLADDNGDVALATAKWAEAFNAADLEAILALYDDDAALWGTTSPTLRTSQDERQEYFAGPFQAVMDKKLTALKVELGDSVIRVYGDAAINTGSYTFSWANDQNSGTIPARFSFTYVKRGDEWKIVDHHSSKVPD